ncbi:GNAT family N-acetyltransferase [Breoghania sp.]|uniref:GNAT family N-acetyltransferase n=1 Tax=Breoghania sp. TaxID=2065378 RepID=UPI002AABEEA2|nr:GNAT family N-acetyltransferase [Breoghania sp.]
MPADLTIRTMTPHDLALTLDWAREEGWNPGLEDAAAFRCADPDGFLMGFVDDEPVAAISVVAYGTAFSFLGLYICRPEFRGKGYGWALWQAGLARLETVAPGGTIGLDGVIAQQDNYARSGFVRAHRNIRYGGLSMVDTPPDPRLNRIGQGLFPTVRDYDRAFFGVDRELFLKSWLAPDARTHMGFALIEDGALRGYGAIRACEEGFKIGPLFAEDDESADILFRALAGQAKGRMVYLDLPEPNEVAARMAERYELSPEFETARMYRGTDPKLPVERIFGITTFELG